jgi:LPS sulfotransferase NodH
LLPHAGHVAAKAGVDQLAMLADAGILDALGPRAQFVLMERRDRLGQAVSRVIAAQSGRFTTAQAANVPDDALVYSRAAIGGELEKIALANALFYAFFAANGIVPVHTNYEEVLADPALVMARIAAAMGDDVLIARPEQVKIAKQANAVNREWRLKYLAGA